VQRVLGIGREVLGQKLMLSRIVDSGFLISCARLPASLAISTY
jgi:hypothetical protein